VKALNALINKDQTGAFSSDTIQSFCLSLINGIESRIQFAPVVTYDGYIPVDYLAAALDPRTKSLSFIRQSDRDLVWDFLNKKLPSVPKSDKPADAFSFFDFAQSSELNLTEVERYQREALCPMFEMYGDKQQYSNPLRWWQERARSYPTLCSLALTYLSIPASSASVERIFSRAGITMAPRRNRLANDIFEAQVLYNDFMRVVPFMVNLVSLNEPNTMQVDKSSNITVITD
jgi:hypothetical protein